MLEIIIIRGRTAFKAGVTNLDMVNLGGVLMTVVSVTLGVAEADIGVTIIDAVDTINAADVQVKVNYLVSTALEPTIAQRLTLKGKVLEAMLKSLNGRVHTISAGVIPYEEGTFDILTLIF